MPFNKANVGAQVTKKLTTARLYWQQPGQASWMDFGNCTEYKDEPKIERVSHMQGERGFWREDFSLAKQVATKKSFTFDERFLGALLLIYLSSPQGQAVQAALTADAENYTVDNTTITADGSGGNDQIVAVLNPVVAGATYWLTRQGVTLVSAVDNNARNLVLGTDYALDAPSGMLTCLNGSAPAGPWTITFTCLNVTDNVLDTFSNLLALGNFKLVEYDQFVPNIPRAIETFSGQVYVTGWGDNKTDNFNEYTVEVLHQNSLRLTRAD